MLGKSYEIENVLKVIDLLKKYDSAKTETKRSEILEKLKFIEGDNDGLVYTLIGRKMYTPKYLIARLQKAIKLDKYRPKNLPIISFAVSRDFNYTNGEFDTFDLELSQMVKNKEKPNKIRKKFERATENINMLSKQFSEDWIRRLQKHKNLVDAAKNATEDDEVEKYGDLFNALTEDFCQEYKCRIKTVVILDWENCNIRPKKIIEGTFGYHARYNNAFFTDGLSEAEIKKLRIKAKKYPEKYKLSVIVINLGEMKKFVHDQKEFFYMAIEAFVHEAHHALDFQKSRQGALGSQVYEVDSNIYVNASKNLKTNAASATEISSYTIGTDIVRALKKARF